MHKNYYLLAIFLLPLSLNARPFDCALDRDGGWIEGNSDVDQSSVRVFTALQELFTRRKNLKVDCEIAESALATKKDECREYKNNILANADLDDMQTLARYTDCLKQLENVKQDRDSIENAYDAHTVKDQELQALWQEHQYLLTEAVQSGEDADQEEITKEQQAGFSKIHIRRFLGWLDNLVQENL